MTQPHSSSDDPVPLNRDDAAGQRIEPVLARLVEAELPSQRETDPVPVMATLVETEPIPARVVDEYQDDAFRESSRDPFAEPDVISSARDESTTLPAVARPGFIRRTIAFVAWTIRGSFCIASLIVLLAVLTAIPVLQLIAFGYLLQVAGGLANGAKLRDSLPHLNAAGQIGLAAVAIFIAALPTQALAHLESVSTLINPGSRQAVAMRWAAIGFSLFMTGYLLWAWVRGGRLVHYLWPQPKRLLRVGWRWSTWRTAPDRLWAFTASLEMPKYFWLGLRGAVGTLVWLFPAMVIIAAFRIGETGLAGLVGFASLVLLGIGMLYLPMLQAHFAAENRLSALFAVRTIRRDFRRAPWAWLLAMIVCLVVTPIPLYLLKIEATPREVMWAPCLLFVAFILPARIATGLALRRARRRPEPSGRWALLSRIFVRMAMPVVVAVYLLFVYVSQYTSWDGLLTWVQQHAILIPVPFLNGV
ncbi:MAG: DUF4013 domain-containing protein [Rubripirellula sp.]